MLSGLFGKGKKTIYNMINSDPEHFIYLLDLKREDLTIEDITTIGERFLVDLYKGKMKCSATSLDSLRYILYQKTVGKAKLSSKFELKRLPPTTDAASFHSLRAYHTIQQWHGRYLDPMLYGWRQHNNDLKPIYISKPPLPDKLSKFTYKFSIYVKKNAHSSSDEKFNCLVFEPINVL